MAENINHGKKKTRLWMMSPWAATTRGRCKGVVLVCLMREAKKENRAIVRFFCRKRKDQDMNFDFGGNNMWIIFRKKNNGII